MFKTVNSTCSLCKLNPNLKQCKKGGSRITITRCYPRVVAGSFGEIENKNTKVIFGSRHTKMFSSYSYMLR
jgi:hypothetical protein